MAIKRLPIGDQGFNNKAVTRENTTEYLTELQGQTGSDNYRQMSKADPVVGMVLRVHKNPISSASWNIAYPEDATDIEKKAIDVFTDQFFGSSGSEWNDLLGKILSMIEYGFSVFEIYYQAKNVDGQQYLMPVIEQRMQSSIWEILIKDRIVRQMTEYNGVVDIPLDDLVFFTINKQGNDLRGQSMLRNAYSAYRRKRTYVEWLGIGVQRSVSGIPSVTVPKGVRTDSPEYQAVESLLANITQHEKAYMILEDGYTFNTFESKFNADPVQKAIDGCNTEIALSVLAQFVMLGQMGNGGAFALSRDQSDFFLDGLKYIIDLICGVVNSRIIAPWVEINFGDKIDPNRIVLTGKNLNKKAGIELSTVLNNLKNSGFIKPTLNDEIMLRDNLEMPELSEEDIEDRKNHPPNPFFQSKTTQDNGDGSDDNNDDDDSGDANNNGKPAIKLSENVKAARKERAQMIENLNKETADVMKANLLMMKDKILADVERTLNTGTVEISGLKNIEVPTSKYLKSLSMKLAGIAQDFWVRARKTAKANNIKLADIDPKDITNKTLKTYVNNQATSIVDKQAAGMLNRAILTASNNSLKGLSVIQTISLVNKSIDDYISSSGVQVDGALIVVGTANFGEKQFYDEIKNELWGYRFMNGDPVSDICQWYNGKTFSVDSPELIEATPPLHPNCYDDKTEVYTDRGWILFKEVSLNNKCLTLNPKSKDLEWSGIKNVFSYMYEGKMHHFTNNQKSLDLMTTPDHTHFYFKRVDRGKSGRKVEPIFSNSDEMIKAGKESAFYLSSEWIGVEKDEININGCVLSIDNYCKLMGYFLSEGSINHGYPIITQEKHRDRMFNDMKDCGFKNVTTTKGRISIWDKRIGKYLRQFGYFFNKFVPEIIKNLPKDKIRVFLDAYRLGDGSYRNNETRKFKGAIFENSSSYFTSSKRMADDIGELLIKTGKAARFYLIESKDKHYKFKNGTYKINHNVWVINEITSKYRKIIKASEVQYSGIVYDVEVEKHNTILVRRNGRVCWNSNCKSYMEPIYKTEEQPKQIDDVIAPPSVREGKTIF